MSRPKKVIIPKLSPEYAKKIDEINNESIMKSQSESCSASNTNETKQPRVLIRRPLMRSSTENFISSLANSSAPFGSILAPLSIHDRLDEEDELKYKEKATTTRNNIDTLIMSPKSDLDIIAKRRDRLANSQQGNGNKVSSSNKHVYSLDFLLSRAEVENSKTMPTNWRDLSFLYPNICFSGKV